MTVSTYRIELAFDAAGSDEDTAQYAAWLDAQGHEVTVGKTTGTYIDGRWTSQDEEAREISNGLWDQFCNSI